MKSIIITGSARGIGLGLAGQILANNKTGAHIRWLTPPKIIWRFLTAPLRKRNLFDD